MSELTLKYEIIDNARGIAFVQAPEQIIGGNEVYELSFIASTLNKSEANYLVLDASNIKAINSSGLGSLIAIMRTLSAKSINFTILNPSTKVEEILFITHLDKVFNLITDLSELQ